MAGRHKKPAGEKKDLTLRVRVTEAELALLEEAAKAKSLVLSAWVRSELVTLARRIVKETKTD